LVQAKSKSDPIWGSLGPVDEIPANLTLTPEEAIERNLQSRTPVEYIDANSHTETQESIAAAEAIVGAKLELPKKGLFSEIGAQPNVTSDSNFKYDEDEDVSETMNSIQ